MALLEGNARNRYGIAKIAAEHLCTLYADAFGLECIVARCFAFVGPDLPLNVHFAIGNFIRDALWGKEIVVHGDGSPVRSYMHQNDLAWWLIELLFRGTAGHAYNVGADRALSIKELAFMVRDILAPEKPVRFNGFPSQDTNRNRYIPDINKACTTQNLTLEYSLEEAIRDTAETLLKANRHS